MSDNQYNNTNNPEECFNSSNKKRKFAEFDDTEMEAATNTESPFGLTNFFISKTYQMIHECDDNIISWNESGDEFTVKDQARLAGECFPLYFSHNNFSSFTRQLNFYRFRKIYPSVKIGPGSDIGLMRASEKHFIFYHERFHRDHPEWLPDIKRSNKLTRGCVQQEQLIVDLQNQVVALERRFDTLSSKVDMKLSEMADKYDGKIQSLQRNTNERNVGECISTERSMAGSYGQHVFSATPPQTLNHTTTGDFMRSMLHMDRTSLSAPANLPMTVHPPVPPPTGQLDPLVSLTHDGINRLVNRFGNEAMVNGMINGMTAAPWAAAVPPNSLHRMISLPAEDMLLALRGSDRAHERNGDMNRLVNRFGNEGMVNGMINCSSAAPWADAVPPNPLQRIISLPVEDILLALWGSDRVQERNDRKRQYN